MAAKSELSILLKPRCVVDCNCTKGGTDLKDQALEL